ncbi:hypothetical protein P0P49_08955, partial [Campylobacter jejuni]|uniref:hypothetical protein n=1 Tax=Campylobacter jejuni TaxID=197 RepID=UPI002F962A85
AAAAAAKRMGMSLEEYNQKARQTAFEQQRLAKATEEAAKKKAELEAKAKPARSELDQMQRTAERAYSAMARFQGLALAGALTTFAAGLIKA